MSKISFIKSDDRKYNIERCLSLIKSEIIAGLKDAKKIVIKPNCVTDNVKLSATNAEALDAVLGFISPYVKNQIIVAEGSGEGNTMKAFKNFGYFKIQDKYDFAVIDLNTDDFKEIEAKGPNNKKLKLKIAKTLLESDYLISISPPKTHNAVVYTGAVKNAAIGGLVRPYLPLNSFSFARKFGIAINYKSMIHQGYNAINHYIASLFKQIPLNLAIIDGFAAMEGNGPINGDLVPAHFAVASSDPVAADWLACQLMEIETGDVGYLNLLGAGYEDYYVIGDSWQECTLPFKMHPDFEKIRKWKQ
jgi:uncharacterized protein (DUF362 family)